MKDRLYDLVASFIIRRALCYLTAKNYNNVFADIAAYLKAHGVSEAAFAAAVGAKSSNDTARYPGDAQLRQAIVARPQYGWIPQHRIKLLLEELEFASRDKFNINGTLQDGLQIEHVMPQTWQTNWPLPSGRVAPADLATDVDKPMREEIDRRQRLIHTLGNLTLLTPPGNASASNSGFAAKQVRLTESLLKINTTIASEEAWDEAAIERRSERLADLAILIWPSPAGVPTEAGVAQQTAQIPSSFVAAKEFEAAMRNIYTRASQETSYRPSYFLQMIEERGGTGAAHALLAGRPSDGFSRLWELKRLDLSVEALALEPRWRGLFEDAELATARRRLKEAGFKPPPVADT